MMSTRQAQDAPSRLERWAGSRAAAREAAREACCSAAPPHAGGRTWPLAEPFCWLPWLPRLLGSSEGREKPGGGPTALAEVLRASDGCRAAPVEEERPESRGTSMLPALELGREPCSLALLGASPAATELHRQRAV